MNLCGVFDQSRYKEAQTPAIWLNGANMENVKMRNAYFSCPDMADVILKNADLRGATFVQARLNNADLRNADLRGASLLRSFLFDTNFTGCKIHNTTFTGYFIDALQSAQCDYVIAGENADQRIPETGIFNKGEFSEWIENSSF